MKLGYDYRTLFYKEKATLNFLIKSTFFNDVMNIPHSNFTESLNIMNDHDMFRKYAKIIQSKTSEKRTLNV